MKRNKSLLFWILVIGGIFLYSHFNENVAVKSEIVFSDFLEKVKNKEISSIEIRGNVINGETKGQEKFVTMFVGFDGFLDELRDGGVRIKISPISTTTGKIFYELLSWLPLILIAIFYFFRFKESNGGSMNPFKFGKSRAKLLELKGKVTFADVAGIEEAKGELKELVDFLKEPDKYYDIGAKIPRGCLLIGAPGTGKTLLARAIAGEAEVPFYFISGSDFVEMFVGVGASRVRDMFEEAKKNSPCLIFIDEIDAVGRQRGVGIGGGNDEREQTLNQLLVEMDGFEGNEGIIVIAATNREDVLDKALLRPGRFDRQITVQLPDIKGREEILKVHAKKVKMAPNIDLKSIAKSTPGFSGAELANIINEAGLLAARYNKKVITNEDIEEAKERVIMGVKNQSRVMKEEEKKITAYHEAGHAVISIHSPNADPIHKATIISRGRAGGYVSRLPEYDKSYNTKAEIIEDITIAMGGRVAEEIIFGEDKITMGAASDIKTITHYAKNMVASWGMSDRVGTIYYLSNLKNQDGYGFEASSNDTLNMIEEEIRKIINASKEKAKSILLEHKSELEIIAEALLKYETLTGDEIKDLINGKEIRTDEGEEEIKSSSLLAIVTNESPKKSRVRKKRTTEDVAELENIEEFEIEIDNKEKN